MQPQAGRGAKSKRARAALSARGNPPRDAGQPARRCSALRPLRFVKDFSRAGLQVSNKWRQFFLQRAEPGPAAAIAVSVACVALAALARLLMGVLGPTLPFATFFPAVLVAALFGGMSAGLLSIVLSIFTVWWVFTGAPFTFAVIDPVHAANFVLFGLSSLLVVSLAMVHRQLLFAVEAKERERQLLVGEIEHRSKNILAVVASLIRQTVQDKDVADTLIGRMCAVADTHGLLDDTRAETSDLRALFTAGVARPYGADRIELSGPDVQLGAKQTRALRLVIHELATNALKYGALSQPQGKVRVTWLLEGGQVAIDWCELDGPKVTAPGKYNFGSRLILATLSQIDAQVEPAFPETGCRYRIVFAQQTPGRA
jgi:two-component sensor histidine kinase